MVLQLLSSIESYINKCIVSATMYSAGKNHENLAITGKLHTCIPTP